MTEDQNNNQTIINDKFKDEIEERKKKAKIFLGVNFAILIVALISLIVIFSLVFKSKQDVDTSLALEHSEAPNLSSESDKEMSSRKIDGVMVESGSENNYLLALMIDNHTEARPPSGLDKANLVFEAEVEGSMTRIMAVFSTGSEIPEIGPVRSARPYFVDWARELSALYAHVGGSPDALVKIQQDKIQDINEFYNGKYFWRDQSRAMPHNVYTSSELLEKYLSDNNADKNRFIPWFFKEDLDKDERPNSSSVSIDYSIKSFQVEWKYERESNKYLRYVAGGPHKTRDGEFIEVANIAVQVADAKELDDKLRLEMNNIGTGISMLCMDGSCQNGSWEKKHPSDRTRFYDEEGKEIKFNRGTTWIQVVRPGIEYSWENDEGFQN